MNRQKYFEFHQECIEKMTSITKKKNADYAGPGSDPFANFTRVEKMGICSTEQGFLTRMTDKMSRLSSFVQVGKLEVLDESVEDTLLDLANYAILMAGYIKSKSQVSEQEEGEYMIGDVRIKEVSDTEVSTVIGSHLGEFGV